MLWEKCLFMPSEKLKYLERLPHRDAVYSCCWSDEEGDRSLSVFLEADRLFVRIRKEWGGVLEVEISKEDALEMIEAIGKVLPEQARGNG